MTPSPRPPGPGRRPPEKTERNAALVHRHRHGATRAALARDFGISEERVAQVVRRSPPPRDDPPRYGSRSPAKTERNAALVAAYAFGLTRVALARAFGISEARVAQLLHSASVPSPPRRTRPVSDGQRDYASVADAARAHGDTRNAAWWRAHKGRRGWRFLGPATVALALLALLALSPGPAAAQAWPGTPDRPCGQLMKMAAFLADHFGEAPTARGLAKSGSLLLIFATADGATWTAAEVSPAGVACVIATGKAWTGAGKEGTPS